MKIEIPDEWARPTPESLRLLMDPAWLYAAYAQAAGYSYAVRDTDIPVEEPEMRITVDGVVHDCITNLLDVRAPGFVITFPYQGTDAFLVFYRGIDREWQMGSQVLVPPPFIESESGERDDEILDGRYAHVLTFAGLSVINNWFTRPVMAEPAS